VVLFPFSHPLGLWQEEQGVIMPSGQEIKHGLLITTTNTMTRVGEKERKKREKKERRRGGRGDEKRKEKSPG